MNEMETKASTNSTTEPRRLIGVDIIVIVRTLGIRITEFPRLFRLNFVDVMVARRNPYKYLSPGIEKKIRKRLLTMGYEI